MSTGRVGNRDAGGMYALAWCKVAEVGRRDGRTAVIGDMGRHGAGDRAPYLRRQTVSRQERYAALSKTPFHTNAASYAS